MIPRGVVALGLVGALACAGVAEAECAWVLWTRTWTWTGTGPIQEIHHVMSAYGTRTECEAMVSARVRGDQAISGPDPAVPGRVLSTRSLCLPDTVDPRAPKSR